MRQAAQRHQRDVFAAIALRFQQVVAAIDGLADCRLGLRIAGEGIAGPPDHMIAFQPSHSNRPASRIFAFHGTGWRRILRNLQAILQMALWLVAGSVVDHSPKGSASVTEGSAFGAGRNRPLALSERPVRCPPGKPISFEFLLEKEAADFVSPFADLSGSIYCKLGSWQ
jgi:hypothetical protein